MDYLKRLIGLLLVMAICISGVSAAGFAADLPETAPAEVTSGTVDANVVLADHADGAAFGESPVSGAVEAWRLDAWSNDALPTDQVKALLNRQELHPQRTGWDKLDTLLSSMLSQAGGSDAYSKLWYMYNWLTYNSNVQYSWEGYSYTTASIASYNSVDKYDYLKDMTYEDGLQKSIPDDMANRTYHILKAGKGVCYDYAIAFAVIARYVGIDAYVMTGLFTFENTSLGAGHHGWSVLVLDGKEYVFDPQRDARNREQNYGHYGYYFGVPSDKTWRYNPNYKTRYENNATANQERRESMLPVAAARAHKVYKVIAKATASGTVSGSGEYDVGATVTLKATPSGGSTFSGWYKPDGTKVSSSASYSFTPESDVTLTALFSGDYFIDVPAGSWYYENAVKAAEQKIVEGYGSPVIFAGSEPFTRAMAVTLIARMVGADVKSAPKAPFSDVPAGKWYAESVNWAYANGVTEGVSATLFGPDKTITRQEFMTMLERYITAQGLEISGGSLPFKDSGDTADWAGESLGRFYARGLVNGDNNGNLLPKKTLTRSEGITFIMRTAEYLKSHGA